MTRRLLSILACVLFYAPAVSAQVDITPARTRFAPDSVLVYWGTGNDASIEFNGTDWLFDFDQANAGTTDFRLREDGTDRIVVLTGGNVGIGESNPDSVLEVVGSFHLDCTGNCGAQIDRGATSNYASMIYQTAGTNNWFTGTSDSDTAGDGSEFFIGTGAGGSSPAFWIETGGNVGIGGETNPDSVLEVVGSFHLDCTGNCSSQIDRGATSNVAQFLFQTGGAANWFVGLADSDVAGDGSEFFISTSGSGASPAFWVETTGLIGIGGLTAPLEDLHLQSASPVIYLETTGGTNASIIIEDTDEAGCTEITVLNGTVSGATVTCPS